VVVEIVASVPPGGGWVAVTGVAGLGSDGEAPVSDAAAVIIVDAAVVDATVAGDAVVCAAVVGAAVAGAAVVGAAVVGAAVVGAAVVGAAVVGAAVVDAAVVGAAVVGAAVVGAAVVDAAFVGDGGGGALDCFVVLAVDIVVAVTLGLVAAAVTDSFWPNQSLTLPLVAMFTVCHLQLPKAEELKGR